MGRLHLKVIMDPVSLVVTAMAQGAASALGDTVSMAVKDAYAGLNALLLRRLGGTPSGQVALDEHENDPETWERPLARAVADSGAATDPQVVAAASHLLSLVDPAGSDQGRYVVDLRGAQGVQVGEGNTQHNSFGAPPAAQG